MKTTARICALFLCTLTAGLVHAAPAPTVANIPASDITFDSARVGATIVSSPNFPPTVAIFYGTTDGGTDAAAWQNSNSLGGVISSETEVIKNLLPDTLYYYRARATNDAGPGWAPSSGTFTTSAAQPPAVANRGAKNVTGTLAEITGEVTSTGGIIPVVTMFWGSSDGGTTPASWTNSRVLGPDPGDFSTCLTGLLPQTVYFYTSRAVNSAGTAWAAASASFTTTAPVPESIIINEINYDPLDHTKATEFIELHNPTAATIDMSGWRIAGGVDYIFPASSTLAAGGYTVVVQNPAAFAVAFPSVAGARGPWTGLLNNGADTVRLENGTGAVVDTVDYKAGFPWPTSPKGGGTSAQLMHPGVDNGLGASWRAAAASPGAPNSILAASASSVPPGIRDVEHLPQRPASNVPVVITARVTDPDGVDSVSLLYQTVNPGAYIRKIDAAYNNPANWTTVNMVDDGTGGDAVAGDCLFTATIPASVQTHRRLVRYRIQCADSLANSITVPYADDEQPNFAYFVYDSVPAWTGAMRPAAFGGFPATPAQTYSSSLLSSIEPYHLIALENDVLLCQYTGPTDNTAYWSTLVYDGEVYDHVQYKIRGIGSTRVSGKNKWGLKFARARDFQARDDWGRKYDEKWNSFGLDANAGPWASVHRGSAGVEEATSYRIFELGGNPALRTHYVHWRVIRKAAESGTAGVPTTDPVVGTNIDGQYTSDFWGLYMTLEPTEGNFLGERNLPDGSIFAIEGGGGDQKYQGANQTLGAADWNAFNSGVQAANQTQTWYRQNVDLKALYTFMGLSRLVGNVDVRPGDNYRFYHNPTNINGGTAGHWVILPYDLDMQFIAASHWGGTLDQWNGTANVAVVAAGAPQVMRAISRHPAIALEFRNRCRELLSLMASDGNSNGGQIGQLIDEYAQMVNPAGVTRTWADADAAMWNLHPRSAGGGGASGQSSHKGNFFRAFYLDGTRGGLGGTVQTGSWRRRLSDPDNDSFSDHEGLTQWLVNFATNTYPASAPVWTRKATNAGPNAGGTGADPSDDRQKGYGYKYLEWESLYGGWINSNANPVLTSIGDVDAAGLVVYPNKPVITYAGAAGYPANDLRFNSSDFADPQGADTIAAVQWRIGEISAPGIPFYDPTQPRKYELEELWTSAELATAVPTGIPQVRAPAGSVHAGHTYRARVRHKDSTGRWSLWSEPVQFLVSVPDIAAYSSVLRVTEVNYNPGPVTPAEAAAPGWNPLWNEQDFEFIELTNVGATAIDLTDVRFTKGVDFDFPAAFSLAAGASAVLAKTPAAFAIRYPGVAIAGTYGTGNFSNGGEDVKLSYGGGTGIIEFTYDDEAPWPVTPDGTGPTLVLIHPSKPGLNHNDPAEWRASYSPNGSPGGPDGLTFAAWAAGYPGIGNSSADDDKDGLNNRVEYGLGGNPLSSSTDRLPTARFQGGYATLTFTHPGDRADLGFDVQFSVDLSAWNLPAVRVSQTTNPGGSVTEVWRSADPVSAVPRLFGRVLVNTP